MGCLRWQTHPTGRRCLTGFLAASGFFGVLQAVLRVLNKPSAWVGGLWALAVMALLFPAVVYALPRRDRIVGWVLHRFGILAWIVYFLAFGQLATPALLFHGTLAVAMVLLGLNLMYATCGYTEPMRSNRALILGGAVALAFACSVPAYAAVPKDPVHGDPVYISLCIFKNCMWCAGYALMAYTLYLEGPPNAT